MFLTTIDDCVVQPLLTVPTLKGLKIKEVTIFTSPRDTRLKCFCEISSQLTDDWFTCVKNYQSTKMPHIMRMQHRKQQQSILCHLNAFLNHKMILFCILWTMKNVCMGNMMKIRMRIIQNATATKTKRVGKHYMVALQKKSSLLSLTLYEPLQMKQNIY